MKHLIYLKSDLKKPDNAIVYESGFVKTTIEAYFPVKKYGSLRVIALNKD